MEMIPNGKSDLLFMDTKNFSCVKSLNLFGFPANILSPSDYVSPKQVLELHVTLTLKSQVVKSFDGLFTAGQLDRDRHREEDIGISGV